MNLAVVTSGFLPVPATKGGAVENLIVNLINENEKKHNLDFTIFSIYDEKAVEEARKYKYTNFVFIKVNWLARLLDKQLFFLAKKILKKENSHTYRYIFQRLAFLNQISKKLKENNYDKVLLENHPTQYLCLKWRKNYLKYKNRYYYHCHNELPGTYGCGEVIKGTKKVLCVSNYIASNFEKITGIDKNKLKALRNGIDYNRFSKEIDTTVKQTLKEKYGIRETDKIILFTGRITKEKGVKELISSLKNLNHDNYKLLILGSVLNSIKLKTKYQEEIEELVEDMKDKVIFTGFINYDEISNYYAIADLAVLPSICEDAAPLTIIEALVSGLPIITTKSGGIPEYARDGSAIIIEKDDNLVKNLTLSIDLLLDDKNKLNEMSKIAKEVSKDLTLENFYNNFCKLIN